MCNDTNNTCCLQKIIKNIINLQNQDFPCENITGCDKPFLGPTPDVISYNTRPISFYNCCTGDLWSFTYTNSEGVEATSTVFRVEEADECCVTCRILNAGTDGTYTSTKEFFTINLNCVSAIRCYADVFIEGIS